MKNELRILVLDVEKDVERVLRALGEAGVSFTVLPDTAAALKESGLPVEGVRFQALEEGLLEAQRLEAMGRLAGGIAHDFNNLLTTVLGYCELAMDRVQPGDPLREELEQIELAGQRAAALTRQLLTFSRRQVIEPRTLDLNAVVTTALQLLRRVIGENIELAADLASGLWKVRADPGQIDQVFMNLVVNARDAMPGGGRLTLETDNVVLDPGTSSGPLPAPPGEYVRLSVADTGTGMDAETRKHIFEPFFTTKKDHGTGLGLATVHGIVRQSAGYISVSSELGRGAVFRILLPRAEETVSEAPAPETESVDVPRGRETILLVEDDAAVRGLARRLLEGAGYVVVEADGGDEALELTSHGGLRPDLLLADIVLPGLSGRDLARRLMAERPGLPVLLMSGYTDDIIARQGSPRPGEHFLQKPFVPRALLEKVRETLRAARGPAASSP